MTSPEVVGSLRTFSVAVVTRTVPTEAGSEGAVGAGGRGSGAAAGAGGGGAAQRTSATRARAIAMRRIYDAILFTGV